MGLIAAAGLIVTAAWSGPLAPRCAPRPLAARPARAAAPMAEAVTALLPRHGATPELPELTADERERLRAGERIKRQRIADGVGDGIVVQEVRVDADAVWSRVSDIQNYDTYIGTVRTAEEYEPAEVIDNTRCYNIVVSRIMLNLDVRFCVDDDLRRAPRDGPVEMGAEITGARVLRYATWELDEKSFALNDSVGFWCAPRHRMGHATTPQQQHGAQVRGDVGRSAGLCACLVQRGGRAQQVRAGLRRGAHLEARAQEGDLVDWRPR